EEIAKNRNHVVQRKALDRKVLHKLIGDQHHGRENRDDDASRRPTNLRSFWQQNDLQADRGDRCRVRRVRLLVEVAKLALDVATQLGAVVALERTQLSDASLKSVALALKTGSVFALLGLSLGANAL